MYTSTGTCGNFSFFEDYPQEKGCADKKKSPDYSPFGTLQDGRKGQANGGDYRYGMNGQEKDNEISGDGNSYTAEFWQYSPRIGKRFNIDPVVKSYESPYACFANNPILFVDRNGADTAISIYTQDISADNVDLNFLTAVKTDNTAGNLVVNVYNSSGVLTNTYTGIKSDANPNGLDPSSQAGILVLSQTTGYYSGNNGIGSTTAPWYKLTGDYDIGADGVFKFNGSLYSGGRDMGSQIGAAQGFFADIDVSFRIAKTKLIASEMENYSQAISQLNGLAKFIKSHSTRDTRLVLESPVSDRTVGWVFDKSTLTFFGHHSPEPSAFDANKVGPNGNPYQSNAPSIALGLTGNPALDIDRAFNVMTYVQSQMLGVANGFRYVSGGESDRRKVTVRF